MLRFNTKPQLGLEYLRGLGLWDGTARALALWLHEHLSGGGLSKRRVGEFFGGALPVARTTFDCWLETCIAGQLGPGVSLDEALRKLLRQFRLPGELRSRAFGAVWITRLAFPFTSLISCKFPMLDIQKTCDWRAVQPS